MDKQLKELFPSWVNHVDSDDKLILTNDLDSLFSSLVLKKMFGCEIAMFYDFNAFYSTEKEFDKSKVIGVDCALEGNFEDNTFTKTFCNHTTKMTKEDIVNPLSANLNNIAGIYGGKYNTNYFRKYCGSTALTILSLYDAFDGLLLDGHTRLTETQLMILASIDSYYYGAYHPEHYEAHGYFYRWSKCLGLEMFSEIFNKYSKQELMSFQREHSLKGSIFVDDTGRLNTYLDIAFLKEHFPMLDWNVSLYLKTKTEMKSIESHYYTGTSKETLGSVFSMAVISRDKVKYTIL